MKIGAWLLHILTPLLLVSTDALFADDDKGILVVTYNTGRNAERLTRVRFRLINEQKEQTMFPRAGTFYENTGGHTTRRVTIPNLPVGNYVIEVVIPNRDALFADPTPRQITITKGEICKVDLSLKPRYGRVKATAIVPVAYVGMIPNIRLCDHHGNVILNALGELDTNNLLPGQYTIIFDPYMNFVTPDPIRFSVRPGAVVGPFERYYNDPGENEAPLTSYQPLFTSQPHETAAPSSTYRQPSAPRSEETQTTLAAHLLPPTPATSEIAGRASLTVKAALSTGTSATLVVASENGVITKRQTAYARNKKIQWSLPDLPTGSYTLSWELPSSYFTPEPKSLTLTAGAHETVEIQFMEAHAIRVSSNIDHASYHLTHAETGNETHGNGRRYSFQRLTPGTYLLAFEPPEGSTAVPPAPMTIQVTSHQDSYVHAIFN